jgi:hypothetical protein
MDMQTKMMELIKKSEQSGMSRLSFCKANSISYHTMNYWIKKLKPIEKPQTFLPVKVVKNTTITLKGGNGLELTLPVNDETVFFVKRLLRD